MLYRFRRDIKHMNFNRRIRDVAETRPIRLVDAPWTIFSMVSNQDVLMYLLSMKSFYARIKRGKLTAIVDRDMPDRLREQIRHHLVGVRLVDLESLDTGKCQRGGTWERLVCLVDHSRDEYAVQVDADTLACGGDLTEVVTCIEENRAFCYRDWWPFPPVTTLRQSAGEARKTPSDHICIATERHFDELPDCDNLKYIRGSSGLAGFAKGAFDRARLEEFHGQMEKILGERWREWGTEQCGSNYSVANSPGCVVLPHPEYRTYSPTDTSELLDRAKFLHFIGTTRFEKGHFATKGLEIMQALR
jgi:hypothetical protein